MTKKYGSGTRNDFSVFIQGSIKMPCYAQRYPDEDISWSNREECILDDNNIHHIIENKFLYVDEEYIKKYLTRYKLTARELKEEICIALKDVMIPDLKDLVLEYISYPCRITYAVKYSNCSIYDRTEEDVEIFVHVLGEYSPLDILRAENGEGNLDFSAVGRLTCEEDCSCDQAYDLLYEFCYAKFAVNS